MTRFHQKFDLLPKLSLRGQLGRLSIIEKYNGLAATSKKRELYLNTFHPFFRVSKNLPASDHTHSCTCLELFPREQ
jgi:hypothetical protein